MLTPVWTTNPLGHQGLGKRQPCWKDLQFQALGYDIWKLLSIKPPAVNWNMSLGLIRDQFLFICKFSYTHALIQAINSNMTISIWTQNVFNNIAKLKHIFYA